MSEQPLVNDASASTKGTIYQLYVGLLKCFEMVSGQKVLFEKCGDITIGGFQQIETKHYQEPLTDNHINFWKTLKNWMAAGFDETTFSSLILYTTQQIGEHAGIAEWNQLDVNQRLALLNCIHIKANEREARRIKNNPGKLSSVPESLVLQRVVLNPANRQKLQSVANKVVIASHSPEMSTLYQRIRDQYCKHILRGKQDDYLNALLGFVIRPAEVSGGAWQITYDEFTTKVSELTTIYRRETRVFPRRYLQDADPPDASIHEKYRTRLFVRKIRDIEYEEAIPQAIHDHLGAHLTILEEYRCYEVSESRHREYEREVLDHFLPLHRIACRRASDIIRESQTFFDEIHAAESPAFHGFDTPPRSFRNGVLHILFDEPGRGLKWRLG